MITTLHQGWLEKKGEKTNMVSGWKKRYFLLSARQEQDGDEVEIQNLLFYFKSQEAASDISEANGVIELADVDEVRRPRSDS